MSTETNHMRKALGYIIVRDLFLLMLIGGHIFYYYKGIAFLNYPMTFILVAGASIWLFYYIQSVMVYQKLKKDPYYREAYHDEYFKNIILKASHHGYTSIFFIAIGLIIISIVSYMTAATVDLPYYIACEVMIFLAIFTDDTSKIILLSR